jgi:2-oxoglutarate-Fe(II)-dependent oxygenase superfamily protein
MMASPNSKREGRAGKLFAHPWPHLIIDNFLTQRILSRSLLEIRSESYDYELESRGAGRIEFSLLKSKTLWRAIYARRTIGLLSSAFGVGVKLNRENWVQLRRMNEDTPEFPLHSDFTSNQDSIASFLYLSSGWHGGCGGRLHLYKSDKDCSPAASIDPIQNRFIAFRTKPCHWHSVEKVSGWERISALALWNVEDPNCSP